MIYTCPECGSRKLETDESIRGDVFICCTECDWVMELGLYYSEIEPNYCKEERK
jgi:transcription initiation factor TFIIIB Brf1 subunit/transcription initiation factor TFIIB|tara:strand:- start:76 stop:237 length:162 start_codon:yes stop_codon:yes gene_type:complete